jgi:hypothetical protein
MLVRHGRLFGVLGHPRQHGDVIFCPALVEIDDPHGCHSLAETVRLKMDETVSAHPDDPPDALWVWSRLPVVFGYRPLQIADGREYLLNHGFVAVREATVIPFACTDICDYFGDYPDAEQCSHCHLLMSRAEDADERQRVARHFWKLLATAEDGQDFRAEGLEWMYAWHPDDCDGGEELLTEVGRWRGRYYHTATAWDRYFDPDENRPDWDGGQWRCRWSRPVRRVRRIL